MAGDVHGQSTKIHLIPRSSSSSSSIDGGSIPPCHVDIPSDWIKPIGPMCIPCGQRMRGPRTNESLEST